MGYCIKCRSSFAFFASSTYINSSLLTKHAADTAYVVAPKGTDNWLDVSKLDMHVPRHAVKYQRHNLYMLGSECASVLKV